MSQNNVLMCCIGMCLRLREFEIAKKKLAKAKQNKELALLGDEEAKQWKESLCGQYQQLVKVADRIKSQKLIYIVDTYGM